MRTLRQFLQGKKTYISAAVIALAAGIGYLTGAVNGAAATAMLGFAGTAAGLGAKSERNAAVAMTLLGDLKEMIAQHRIDPRKLGTDVAKSLFTEVSSLKSPPIAVAGTSTVGTGNAQRNVTEDTSK